MAVDTPFISPALLADAPDTLLIVPPRPILRSVLQQLKAIPGAECTEQKPIGASIPWHRVKLPVTNPNSGGEVSFAIAGPLLGSPAAVLLAETFIASGTKRIVLAGAAGGLVIAPGDIQPGMLITPEFAISEEGTSGLYGRTEQRIEFSNPALQTQLSSELALGTAGSVRVASGGIWTTDAPFMESGQKVQQYCDLGAIAVEMECSALLQLCNYRNCSFAAVFVVSDLLGSEWTPHFGSPAVRGGIESLAILLARFCVKLHA